MSTTARTTGIAERLSQEILDGTLEVGQVLSEGDLARRYGVSRTPVREALVALEHSGIVQRHRSGVLIAEPSATEILDIYDVRVALEGEASRLAALRRTDLDLGLLAAVCDAADSEQDLSRLAILSKKFHEALRNASHNDVLVGLLQQLDVSLARFRGTTLAEAGRPPAARRQHRDLLRAIRDHHAEEAERISRAHLVEARAIRLEQYARAFGENGSGAPVEQAASGETRAARAGRRDR